MALTRARSRGQAGRGLASALGLLAVLALAACSSTKTAAPSATTAAGTDSAAAAVLQEGYQGRFDPLPTAPSRAVAGKTVWNISCGQAFATCALISKEFEAAGKELGWDVSTQDSKGDPTTTVSLLKQAVAAKVDGVAIMARDCPLIKSGLLATRAANIPVVNLAGADCDNPRFGNGGEPL
ncbi:MAG: substrate-binding domain-containing protein, partial [Sporichthyaceae bacterium]|nr:substrate-binding domain-containing protein [Sporichthyaceae bacterium]